jgi:hypothetical protein
MLAVSEFKHQQFEWHSHRMQIQFGRVRAETASINRQPPPANFDRQIEVESPQDVRRTFIVGKWPDKPGVGPDRA